MKIHRPVLIACLAVAVLSFIAFLPALGADFVDYDDDVNFTTNLNYRGFTGGTLAWMWSNMDGHYIPITWMTLALDYEIWGMDARGYHSTNLLFHAANAVLLFFVLSEILRRLGLQERRILWAAGCGALLFSLHPLRVESVAWVTERRDVVCGLFCLTSVWAYLRAQRPETRKRRSWLALSIAAFALSLLSKTMSMGLPFVLWVVDYAVLKRKPALGEKAPYFALFVAAVVVTYVTQLNVNTLTPGYSLGHRILQPGFRTLFYVAKTALPLGLSPVYSWLPNQSPFEALYVAGFCLAAGATFAFWRWRARWPGLFAAWLAFGFLIAPVSGVFQAGPHFAADRYTYLAVIPFSVLMAAILPDSRLSWAAAAATLAVLGGLSWRQTKVWKNSESLWDHAVAVRPKDPVALNNRGGLRASKGRIKEAMADFEACLQVLPSYPSALANRARARALSGDGAGALRDIDEALRQDPNLATLTEVRGIARMTTGDAAGALADFDQALSRPPRKAEILYLRGSLRHQRGALAGAFEDYSEALGLNPNLGEAWFNRGLLQEARGARDAAVGDFARCVSLNPKDVAARLKYGAALRARGGAGDVDAAILELEKALREAPAGWPARSAALAELDAAKRLKR